MKHNWIPLCSDINTNWANTYYWYRCSNCGKETKHYKQAKDSLMPDIEGCEAKKQRSIFPISSI